MNYGGDAADQIVRYSMEGMEHTLQSKVAVELFTSFMV